MNILITGLTLHNNKGGPALAYSLVSQLRRVIPKAKFFLSVPNDNTEALNIERELAPLYDIAGIIGQVSVKEMLFPFYLRNPYWRRRQEYQSFLQEIDLIVDLVALSYMDLRHHSMLRNLLSNLARYTTKYFANRNSIPMIRWTQSYGPFIYPFTKYITKIDLMDQKHIFARGEISKQYLSKIIPESKIRVFPDIAITLPYTTDYVASLLAKYKISEYITISPSSVLYQIQRTNHIHDIAQLINYLSNKNYHIVLVPHNLRTINPTLENCDLKISELIMSQISTLDKVILVSEDLNPMQLKGVISQAKYHIGARYHSVIAALSTGIPAVSLAWHEKYQDLMKMYRCEQYVSNDVSEVINSITEIEQNYVRVRKELQETHLNLLSEIEHNVNLFLEMI